MDKIWDILNKTSTCVTLVSFILGVISGITGHSKYIKHKEIKNNNFNDNSKIGIISKDNKGIQVGFNKGNIDVKQ